MDIWACVPEMVGTTHAFYIEDNERNFTKNFYYHRVLPTTPPPVCLRLLILSTYILNGCPALVYSLPIYILSCVEMITFSGPIRRSSCMIDFKLKILQWYNDHGENNLASSRYFKVDRKTVYEWVDNEAKLKSTRVVGRKKQCNVFMLEGHCHGSWMKQCLHFNRRASGRTISKQ